MPRRSAYALPPRDAPGLAPPNPIPVPGCNCRELDHFVQFYEHDEFLTEAVGRFVLEGLAGGGTTLVVGTAPHRATVEGRLRSAGVNLGALRAAHRYATLDADEVCDRLMVDGAVSPEAFARVIGEHVTQLTASGRKLRVFGEIVALMWKNGNQDAAIQLEELWNDLARRRPFTLFCAYPLKGFAARALTQRFLEVCRTHSRVLPSESYAAPNLTADDRLQAVALLQQKAAVLETEVAERKQLEHQLRQREAELTSFVETAVVGLHWVGPDGNILWANPAELEMLGYTREEYVGRHISEFHADKADIDDILLRLVRGEKLRDYRTRLKCRDGSIKTVLLDSNVYREDGRFVRTQCFTRDITEQVAAEAASRWLAAIVESSDDAIVSKNLDGIITSWNAGAERLFGYTAEEAVGRSITILIPPDRLDEEPKIIERIRSGQRVDHFETVRRCKDGRLLDVSLTISPVKNAEGGIVGASKIARDITEAKGVRAALQAARDQLARANLELERRVGERTASLREAVEQMEEFSYTVSHDLRAPLRGMQVYSQTLLEDHAASLDPEARHCLVRIAENATRLDRLVTDLLTYSRVSRAELAMEPVSLDRLVAEIVQHYPRMQPPDAHIAVERLSGACARTSLRSPRRSPISSRTA